MHFKSARTGGRPRKTATVPPESTLLSALVAPAFGVSQRSLFSRTRGVQRTAGARQVAMYLAHVCLGESLTMAAGRFRRDRGCARHACRLVEDRREEPGFDLALTCLEGALRLAVGQMLLDRQDAERRGSRA